jgi:MFS family permease
VKGALQPGVRPRELWAWAMYDFANSGFTTVVITALFNAYFVTVVAGNTPWATFAWTASLSVSYVLIVLSGPLLGAYADRHAAKKRLLLITTAGCVLFTALLWFARPELLWYSVACVIAANFFFGSGENLIAAFLPELAQPRTLGRVSGWGWSLGYLGGLLTLGLCLAYVTWAEARGHGAAEFVPVTMLITAGIFALASLPTFLLLKERAVPRPADAIPCSAPLAEAWREVGHTLRQTRQFADLARFLLCSLFYQAGIQTVITLAAIYAGQAMGFGTRETLLLVFAVNITAAIGAFAFGRVQDRIGHVRCHRADPRRLDRHRTDRLGRASGCGRRNAVLDRGESRRPVHGCCAIGWPRLGGTAGPVVPVGRVLRLLGTVGQAVVDRRTAFLWHYHLGLRRRPPQRPLADRQLFRHRTVPALRREGGARSTRRAARRTARQAGRVVMNHQNGRA